LDSRVDLDIVGALENADKSSCVRLSWDYLRHYEWMLTELRDAPINLIEIGVAGGPSMRIWRWFFSQAQIIGIDIDPNCKRHAGDRVQIEIGSQIDPVFLDRVCAENPPTVIVDDGSHIMEHMIFSFEHLFPKLLPGGIYIVEDFWGFIGVDAMEQSTEAGQNAPEYFLQVALLFRKKRGTVQVAGAAGDPGHGGQRGVCRPHGDAAQEACGARRDAGAGNRGCVCGDA
jgi:hypothetical protein